MPNLSHHFTTLFSAYTAELDDLRTDSEGKNVLQARLSKKREQISALLMMISFSPEMVAVAFHGAFAFNHIAKSEIETWVTREPARFPAWATFKKNLTVQPWAQPLINTVLTEPGGALFLITTVALEYLYQRHSSTLAVTSELASLTSTDESDASNDRYAGPDADEDDRDDDGQADYDLDQAGADWLERQGFDRKE